MLTKRNINLPNKTLVWIDCVGYIGPGKITAYLGQTRRYQISLPISVNWPLGKINSEMQTKIIYLGEKYFKKT